MTTAAPLLAHLVQAEATDRAVGSIRSDARRFPVHRDLAGFDFTQTKSIGERSPALPRRRLPNQRRTSCCSAAPARARRIVSTAVGIEAVTRHS
jgi:hypothetical protein